MYRIRKSLTCVLLSCFCFSGIYAVPREDPLIGQIVDASTQKSISEDLLMEKMLDVDVVYLGEKHDNSTHHEIQQKLLETLIAQGKKPVLGFEFFYQHQTSDLMQYLREKPSPFRKKKATPEELEKQLRQRLGWQNRPDKDWQYYFSLVSLAKTHGLVVFGADLPIGLVTRISRNGLDILTPVEIRLLQTTGFMDESYQELMDRKFKDSHCGWSSPDVSKRLYQSWIVRNDAMAQAISAMISSEEGPIVFIVGGGHVEHNMGIYERVQHLSPGARQLNLGLTEIFIEPAPLMDYIDRPKVGERTFLPNHEYYWFTQRADYKDPCEKFQMK